MERKPRPAAACALLAAVWLGLTLVHPARPFLYRPNPPRAQDALYRRETDVVVLPLVPLPPKELRRIPEGTRDLTLGSRGHPPVGGLELAEALARELRASGGFRSAEVKPGADREAAGALVVSGRVLEASATRGKKRTFTLALELRAAQRRAVGDAPWEFEDDVFWVKTYRREDSPGGAAPERAIERMLRSLYAEALDDMRRALLAREATQRLDLEAERRALARAQAWRRLREPALIPGLAAEAPPGARIGASVPPAAEVTELPHSAEEYQEMEQSEVAERS
ncbi:MAG: hypothetical protein HY059_23045 [Proteobacteria bacterium]|nr:hypothetical protein [Pseudomonadota bacterium]